uniref:NADH-ubiquinone oxidoreductase chain 2 n=1 Tax=Prosadenoporus spectaculum TaxID=1332185 RepID=X2C8E4_9BILA|nr:NADH dehydrogenase subunit 2 [Prosadenoporus spectaculum]AGL46783.1 NADH dehydrogenase subunit 2 [Prosadenoporus spectaculum]
MFFPFYFLMGFLVFLGSLLSISSSSWFGIWGGLELKLLCFLPVMMHFSSFMGVESVVKYFLVQSFGSVGVLLGGLFEDSFFFGSFGFLFLFLCFSLFLKVGVFPFHWWVPGVMSGFSWFGVLLLSTWQKVAPVAIFSCLCSGGFVFLIFSVFSSFVSGISGIGQTSIRSVLAFSSIGHAGWFFSLFCVSWFFGFVYFFIYLVSSFSLIFFVWFFDYIRLSQFFISSLLVCFSFFVCVLTVSGVPPFLGFFSKLLGFLAFGISLLNFFFLFVLILGSLFSLYFYLGLFFSCFFFLSSFVEGSEGKFFFFVLFCLFVVFFGFAVFFLDFFFFL